jgi:hypothetical protein
MDWIWRVSQDVLLSRAVVKSRIKTGTGVPSPNRESHIIPIFHL